MIVEFIDHRVEEQDLSNLLVVCKPDEKLTYYAGFAWKKSNQFSTTDEFDEFVLVGSFSMPLSWAKLAPLF